MKYCFLLPAYKGHYLKEMLESIQAQTYDDFAVIISDDCSPEDLYSIVRPFLADKRFSYCRNKKNYGAEHLVDHWNHLLGLASSEFVIMASDDDSYDKRFLESMDDVVRSFPEVDVFRPLIHLNEENTGAEYWDNQFTDFPVVLGREKYLQLVGGGYLFSGISQFVYRRTALEGAGGFVDYPYAWFSDDATSVVLSGQNGIGICPHYLFNSRVWSNSISGGKGDSNVVLGKAKASAMYGMLIYGLDEYEKVSFESTIRRIREVAFSTIREYSFPLFLKYSFSYHIMDRHLFPLSWCAKKSVRKILNRM